MPPIHSLSRRAMLRAGAGLALTSALPTGLHAAQPALTRAIPTTGERIPAVGMGTWITFNVGDAPPLRAGRKQVLETFFEHGGGMVDSSPMYGSAEDVMGWSLAQLQDTGGLFSATKVWTPGRDRGIAQMRRSLALWGLERFDLMQVHNLLDWEVHLETLAAWKREGLVRYVGVSTSHGRRHGDLAEILRTRPVDFVQLTYNAVDREAERRLLPLARDRGIAVIVNRPFRRGALVDAMQRHQLPAWAAEIDCANWPQVLLKYILSHPAVTCAIPATSQVAHMRENMGAMRGRLPDAAERRRIAEIVQALA